MKVIKRVPLLLIIGSVSLAAGAFALKQTRASKQVQVVPKIEVFSAIPRNDTGRYHLGDIDVLDNGDAWAVGYDGEHTQRVYHSTDRGTTWKAVDVPGNGFTLKAINFSDSQHGWAVGGNGLIISTTTGGKSWELLKPPTSSELHQVHFANSRVGYVAGSKRIGDKITDEVTGSVEILCTKDAGETWQNCYKEDKPAVVFQITTFSDSGAYVVLDGNRLIRTDDGGTTWRPVDLSGKQVVSVGVDRNGSQWIVGRQGVFQRSENDGKTWQQVSSLAGGKNWWGIAFNEAGTGVAVGEGGLIGVTLDKGKTWQLSDSGIRDDLGAVRLQGNYALITGSKKVYSVKISSASVQEGL